MDAPSDCDLVVVGAGILGLAVARELLARHPGARLAVLEKEERPALHQTGRNSGVVHAGIYYAPGSLKARLCVEGARELYEYCERRGVPFRRCGKAIVATRAGELPELDELERRGRANGVPGLRRIGPDELRELEPHAAGIAALHSPSTGVVDFAAVARALAEDVVAAGGALVTGCEVRRVRPAVTVEHAQGETRAAQAVVCAGAWADRLAGEPAEPRIVPFRGAYLELRPERRHLVQALIYPVPDPSLPFLGVHLSRHLDGVVTIGPTALIAAARDPRRRASAADLRDTLRWPGTWRMARRFWRMGAKEAARALAPRRLAREAARYVPELRPGDTERGWSGVRAQCVGRDGRLLDDFVLSERGSVLHVLNAPSPAATASLAIAREIVDRLPL